MQAQSALFLLVQSSRAPDLDALESTAERVREWVGALGDRLAGLREHPEAHDTGELGRLHLQLARTQQTLERFAPFRARQGGQVSAAFAMQAITAAHQQLRLARRDSETFTDILASCCAADVTEIAQRRNR